MPNRKIRKITGYVRVDYGAVLGELSGIVRYARGDDAVEVKFEIHQLADESIALDCEMPGERESYEDGVTRISNQRRLYRGVWRRIMTQFADAKERIDTTDDNAYRVIVAMHSLEQVYGYLRDCTLKLRMEVEYDEHIPA